MKTEHFRELLNSEIPAMRLRGIQELCKRAEKAKSELERYDLFLTPVIETLEREQDAETFATGCQTIASTLAHWVWTHSDTFKELCSGSPAREEILISVLTRLQIHMDEQLGVEKHFQYDGMETAIREPEFFELLRSRPDLTSEFIVFWIQVLQWNFQGKRFLGDLDKSDAFTQVRDPVLLTRLNKLRHRLSRKKST